LLCFIYLRTWSVSRLGTQVTQTYQHVQKIVCRELRRFFTLSFQPAAKVQELTPRISGISPNGSSPDLGLDIVPTDGGAEAVAAVVVVPIDEPRIVEASMLWGCSWKTLANSLRIWEAARPPALHGAGAKTQSCPVGGPGARLQGVPSEPTILGVIHLVPGEVG
jgi:hypothetical protein